MSYLKLASSLSLQKLMVCAWFARQEMPFQQADLPIQRSVEEVVRSSVNLVSYDLAAEALAEHAFRGT